LRNAAALRRGLAAGWLDEVIQYRPTRRLDREGPIYVLRARSVNDAGPGCYVLKTPVTEDDRPCQSVQDLANAQLRREAEVARQVGHRNLTTVLDIVTWGRSWCLVLPYRDGATLRHVLDWYRGQHTVSPTGLPLWWVVGILRQVASALAAMHQSGWMHGQVLPEHVLIHPAGYACLIDLTGARRLETPECSAGGGAPTSPTYTAPEWASPGGLVTAVADVYALGCVLWECLTGRPPFTAATAAELARLHRRAALPALRSLRPDVAWDVAAMVHQMLAKEPLRRPSAAQVEKWLAEVAVDAFSTGDPQHVARLAPKLETTPTPDLHSGVLPP
jgi:serine/threonine protein kinase